MGNPHFRGTFSCQWRSTSYEGKGIEPGIAYREIGKRKKREFKFAWEEGCFFPKRGKGWGSDKKKRDPSIITGGRPKKGGRGEKVSSRKKKKGKKRGRYSIQKGRRSFSPCQGLPKVKGGGKTRTDRARKKERISTYHIRAHI